ncbi:MAG: autotransporter domain-containing protein, partial [Syntrophobacteraceae bacterium]
NSGSVTTSGIGAYGIFAQSVGGGGGSGSDGSNGLAIPSEDLTNWKSWVLPSLDLAFSVGGSAGSSGAGSSVTVTNTGAITTTGDGADGVYAQSLGGGGGVAAYDQSQMFTDKESNGGGTDNGLQFGTIAIGGSGGAAGNGGAVQVTNGGDIATSGQQAYGIYAQSIGGGGGAASTLGGPWHGMNFTQYFGLAVNIGGSGGGGGSGGNVTVTDTANITTSGNDSDGILAQSVGGSGGSGSTTNEFLWGNLYNGSNFSGASGTGGNVTVTQTGNITTCGQDADGIVAQSTAGGDTAGNVTVTLNGPNTSADPGNIIANGLGSSGIVAQSLGANGDGNIDVVINAPGNSGTVQGGHSGTATNPDGSTTTYNAYGVLIMDGNQNTLNNLGTITTLDGANGTAIMQQTSYGAPSRANLDVYNHGTITGSITSGNQAASSMNSGLSLPGGTSSITVNNYQGATYNAGPVVNLGAGTLINGGFVSLGTTATTLTGNYTQTNTGQLQVTLGNNGSCGSLNISSAANLDGRLQINLNNTQPLQNGMTYSVLTGKLTGSFSNLSLAIPNTPLLSFSVAYVDPPGADTVQIKPLVNSFSSVAYDPTTSAVGGFLDQLFAKDPNGRFALLLAEFQRLDPAEFRTAFDSLTPSVYWAATNATFDITREYERSLQQRLESMRSLERAQDTPGTVSESSFPLLASVGAQGLAGAPQAPGGIGFWMQGFGQWGSQDAPDSDNGYDFGSNGFALGLDHAFSKNLILGANFAYSYTTLDMYGMPGTSDINSLYGSAYGTWFNDRSYVESILTYGNHQYSMNRMVTIGSLPQSLNSSNHRGNAFSILTEAGHSFPVCQWDVEPFASIGYYNLGESAIDEAGTLASMRIGSRTTDEVFSEVGVKVERSFHTSKGVLLPMLKAGWQHGFGLSPDTLPVSFANTPVNLAVPVPDMSQDMAVIRAGLTFKANSGLTTSLGYIGVVGNKAQSNAVVGELRIPF